MEEPIIHLSIKAKKEKVSIELFDTYLIQIPIQDMLSELDTCVHVTQVTAYVSYIPC